MEAQQFLGLDVGAKHTGIARGALPAKLAEPLLAVATDQIFDKLGNLIKEYEVTALVVGLPRNLSGDDTAQTKWVRDWVVNAKAKIELPFYWQDEALTSHLAKSQTLDSRSPVDEHALAAAIILQDFLDTPAAERVAC